MKSLVRFRPNDALIFFLDGRQAFVEKPLNVMDETGRSIVFEGAQGNTIDRDHPASDRDHAASSPPRTSRASGTFFRLTLAREGLETLHEMDAKTTR
jgi:hypothetical protein